MLIATLASLAALGAAASVQTVPWNGHTGAVTFTFDDGCASQLKNVVPALKARGLHATFFLIGNEAFTGSAAAWKQAALDGNELGNHTLEHLNLTELDSAAIAQQVGGQAAALRAFDPKVEAVTLAYPYCGTNTLVSRITNRESIIARTCGGAAQFDWNKPPSNWMQATSFVVEDSASTLAALAGIDSAASGNRWFVTLNHGVGGDWMAISTPLATSMFDRALAKKVWVGTYQEVAAYWRASRTMDTVTARTSEGGWTLRWVSPHPRMPRRVPLRIRLDPGTFGASFTVSQDGAKILPEADGSYVVDFMKLGLEVEKASTGVAPRRPSGPARANWTDDGLRLAGLPAGTFRYRLWTLAGDRAAQGNLRVVEDGRVALDPGSRGPGILEIRSDVGTRSVVRVPPRF